MGNEVSAEIIAAAGAASASAAAATGQQQERRRKDDQRKGHVETAPNEESPPPLDDSNTERHVAIDLLGLKDRPVNPSNDDDFPAHFQQDAAATNAAAAAALAYAAAEEKAMEQQVTDYFKNADGDEDDSDEDEVKSTGEDSKDTTDTEESRHVVKKKGGGKPTVTVQTVYKDEDEEEEEEQGISVAPLRASTRIKARQEAAAKERKRASLLRERAPTSKKAMIKKATKAGLDIRKAFKAAGKLGKLDRVLERKGSQSADTLRNRKARSLPTRKRSEEAKSKVQETRKAHQEKRKAQEEPKAPEEETAEETPTKNKRGSKRRKVDTRPTSVNCVKDRTVRAKFAVTAKHLSELQHCSTWENKIDCNEKPKSQHFMYTYDEMVQKPHCSENSRTRRPGGPSSIFLCPEDYELKELGQRLIAVGKEMMRKNGEGYHCTTDPNEYHDLVFGEKIKLNR